MTAMLEYMEIVRRFSSYHIAVSHKIIIELTVFNAIATVASFFPFALFLGTILFFVTIHSKMELTAIRCIGVSTLQISRCLLLTTLLIGTVYITLFDGIASCSVQRIKTIEAKLTKKDRIDEKMTVTNKGVWFRDVYYGKSYIIYAKSVLNQQHKLLNVRFFEFNENDGLQSSIYSDSATISSNVWELRNAKIIEIDGTEKVMPSVTKKTQLSFSNIDKMTTNPKSISFWSMGKYIAMLEKVGLSSIKYKINWYSRISAIIQMIALVLLAIVFCIDNQMGHRGRYPMKLAILLLFAFPMHLINNVMMALGENGSMPIWVAAFALPALIIGMVVPVLANR
jgi:lipopolysaccharide export system permease protein